MVKWLKLLNRRAALTFISLIRLHWDTSWFKIPLNNQQLINNNLTS